MHRLDARRKICRVYISRGIETRIARTECFVWMDMRTMRLYPQIATTFTSKSCRADRKVQNKVYKFEREKKGKGYSESPQVEINRARSR